MNIIGRWIRKASIVSEDAQIAYPQPEKPRIRGNIAILVSPKRDQARLVSRSIADHFYDHMDRAIMFHGGEVRIFRKQEVWNLAVEIIDRIEKIEDMAETDYNPHVSRGE